MRFKTVAVMLAIWAAALLLKLPLYTSKPTFTHDGVIAVVEAAGNMGYYKEIVERNEAWRAWERAGIRKTEVFKVKPFAFSQIAKDLASTDIHPPLYFWLLNVPLSFTGVGILPPILLNEFLLLLQMFLLLFLAEMLLGRRLRTGEASALAIVFLTLPGNLILLTEARQYLLLNLLSVALVVASLRKGKAGWMLVVLFAFLGFLTQYIFYMVVLSVAVYYLLLRDFKRVFGFLTASALGFALSFYVFPHFFDQTKVLSQMRGHVGPSLENLKFLKWLVAGFFEPFLGMRGDALLQIYTVFLVLVWAYIFFASFRRLKVVLHPIFVIPVVVLTVSTLQHLTGISPPLATGVKYAPTLLAFVALAVWMLLPEKRFKVSWISIAIPSTLLISILGNLSDYRREREALSLLKDAPRVLADQYHRGITLNLLYALEDSTLIGVHKYPRSLDVAENLSGRFVYANIGFHASIRVSREDLESRGIRILKESESFAKFFLCEK